MAPKPEEKKDGCAEFLYSLGMKKPHVPDVWEDNPEYAKYKAWTQQIIQAENQKLKQAGKEVTLRFKPPYSYLENGLDMLASIEGELTITLDFKDPLNARNRTVLNRKMAQPPLQEPLLAKGEY